MSAVITARGLAKHYGKTTALKGLDFQIEAGRIVGLIGPNGAGKTTALKAILGLAPYEGELKVLGLDPRTQRNQLMQDVCFIADVAVLPRWIRVREAIDFVEGVHPRFSREKCEAFLKATKLTPDMKVKAMSKGMIVQLHLALVMAIDARLLVLDEPTLGLDILYRKAFYQHLLNDYFDHDKTIIVDGHTVETGSFNFAPSAETLNSENVVVIRNAPEVVRQYLAHWQSRWDLGKPYVAEALPGKSPAPPLP